MDDMYLRVSLSMGVLDFEGSRAQLDIRQPRPRLEIIRHKGKVTVRARHPKLEIDGEDAHAAEGREAVTRLTLDAARQAIQDAQTAAMQYNAEGKAAIDSLARGRLARANASRPHFNPSGGGIRYTPVSMPHVRFTENSLEYCVEPDWLEYRWTVYPRPEFHMVRSAQLKIRVRRYGTMNIELARRRRLDMRA